VRDSDSEHLHRSGGGAKRVYRDLAVRCLGLRVIRRLRRSVVRRLWLRLPCTTLEVVWYRKEFPAREEANTEEAQQPAVSTRCQDTEGTGFRFWEPASERRGGEAGLPGAGLAPLASACDAPAAAAPAVRFFMICFVQGGC